ncbi:MAG: hypothetical protein IJY39_06560 [Clostridia bacterium]|nr:hypothetical protein [Clostridia bacterium]
MDFYTATPFVRPVRLTEKTRQFAYESLHFKYGKDTEKTPAITLDGIAGVESLTSLEKYDLAISEIAKSAPVRICDGELISGAATLGLAISHLIPATVGGKHIFPSISHLTVDFETVLKIGVNGIRKRVEESLKAHASDDKTPFLHSCLNCLDSFALWHSRYLDALKDREELADNYKNLSRVPMEPPSNFYEAVQSIWFTFAFIRLCGNWPGIGRIDKMLGPYLKKDLEDGALTLDGAREILAHFFIKGCEWIRGELVGSGDAQHYQNLVISGVDEDGADVTNDVTYLVLDIIEELGIGDFPTTVRINLNTDEKLLRRVSEVIRLGGGVLAVYNEDLILDALTSDGYELREARNFANDGCWEVQVPGKTCFSYVPFDSLHILQQKTLENYSEAVDFESFEALYGRFIANLSDFAQGLLSGIKGRFKPNADGQWIWYENMPCTVVSLFEGGCIEKGLSYLEGGPVYNVISPHIGGLADTVNSLYAIKKLVYDEKKLTLSELLSILRDNWKDNEHLRLYALNKYRYFGNDNDEIDQIYARLLSDFAEICREMDGECGYHFPAGVSTFGRQIEWAPHRLAVPYGKFAGDVLAGNCSPTPGTDREGVTAMIKSYCKADLSRLATGAALDVKLLPSDLSGERGIDVLSSLIKSFCSLGGFFMQLDVADASLLREAQRHPENYSTLSVRVSGWNARFATLSKDWQDMIIAQTEGK